MLQGYWKDYKIIRLITATLKKKKKKEILKCEHVCAKLKATGDMAELLVFYSTAVS